MILLLIKPKYLIFSTQSLTNDDMNITAFELGI